MLIGIETHVCLLQTALELILEGKNVYVVADAVGSRHAADRDCALARMRQEGARIVSREMVVFEWLGGSGNAALPGREPGVPARMNVIAILAALGLEQWRAFHWRAALEQLFVRYARTLERKLNGGSAQQGMVAALAALAPPVLVAGGVYFALDAVHPLLGLVWNVAALYLLMGFRRFSHAYTNVEAALKANDLNAARRALAAWRGVAAGELSSGEIATLAIERGLIDSYRQVFATLFWFAVLPGPVGAVLYRAASLLAQEWRGEAKGTDTTPIASVARGVRPAGPRARSGCSTGFRRGSRRCRSRSSATSRTPRSAGARRPTAWADEEGGEHAGIVLASGAGALGMELGGPVPTVGGEPDVRPDLGSGDKPEADLLPSACRTRLACARALAPADAAAHARELGAVVARRRGAESLGLRTSGARGTRPPRRPLELEAIADAGFGQDVAGLGGVRFEFLPQVSHVDADIVIALDVTRSPDFAEQVTMRQHLARVAEQQGQEPVFDGRQMHDNACLPDHAVGLVDLHTAESESRRRRPLTPAPAGAASRGRAPAIRRHRKVSSDSRPRRRRVRRSCRSRRPAPTARSPEPRTSRGRRG